MHASMHLFARTCEHMPNPDDLHDTLSLPSNMSSFKSVLDPLEGLVELSYEEARLWEGHVQSKSEFYCFS